MVGRTLAVRYELQTLIAEGPVFSFYAAKDRLTGRILGVRLVKEPFNNEPVFIQSLVQSFPGLQVQHPSIERVDEILEADGQHFLLGELPKGTLLTERIRHFAPFSVGVAFATAIAICEGLCALHSEGIVHGDVGAHNVIATHEGGAKLQLSGVWRVYASSRTAGPSVLPSMAHYMAPEVSRGTQPSENSDLYGLGVILFQLLTGRVPFEGDSPSATVARHATRQVPSARGLNPAVPTQVDQFLQRLLSKSPLDRPSTAMACLSELRKLNDALKFGRGSSVPVANTQDDVSVSSGDLIEPRLGERGRPANVAPVSEQRPNSTDLDERVAPRMSAIRDPKKKKAKKERDVPIWLLGIFLLLLFTMVGFMGTWIFTTFQKPKLVSVPNFNGLSFVEAQTVAKRFNLTVKISGRESNDQVEIDKIISERPTANQKIPEGGTVYVVLSSGSRFVTLPKLEGLTVDEAKGVLAKLNLEIGGVPIRQIDTTRPPGLILRQMPAPNQKVERMTPVRVWIASPPNAPPGSLPGEMADGPSAFTYKISVQLTDATERVRVRIEMSDARETRVIFDEEQEPDALIERTEIGYGPKVKLRIYYDDVLRLEEEKEPENKNAN